MDVKVHPVFQLSFQGAEMGVQFQYERCVPILKCSVSLQKDLGNDKLEIYKILLLLSGT